MTELVIWLIEKSLALTLVLSIILLCRKLLMKLGLGRLNYPLWLAVPACLLVPKIEWAVDPSTSNIPAPDAVLPAFTVTPTASSAPWLTLIWLSVAVLLLAMLSYRHWRFITALGRPKARHVAGLEVLECAPRLETPIKAPLCIGLFRPRIWVPDGFSESLEENQKYWVLQHELTHSRRYDPLMRLFAEVVRAVFWFHPLTHLSIRRFIIDQEISCDHATLASAAPSQRQRYASSLLALTVSHAGRCPAACHAEHHLKERIMSIAKNRSTSAWLPALLYVSIIGVTVIGSGVIYASGVAPEPADPPYPAPSAISATDPSLPTPAAPVAQPTPDAPPSPVSDPRPVAPAAPAVDPVPVAVPKPDAPFAPVVAVVAEKPNAGEHPVVINHVEPLYPKSAAKQKVEGKVVLQAIIRTDGQVDDIKVLLSHPEGVFDQYAVDAFKQWQFASRSQPHQVQQVFEFKLD